MSAQIEYAEECGECTSRAIAWIEARGASVEWSGEYWVVSLSDESYWDGYDADLICHAQSEGMKWEDCQSCAKRRADRSKEGG